MNKKVYMSAGIIAGIIFFIIGYIYATKTAGMLPAFFPGHIEGATKIHYKHAIASFVVGVGFFIAAWFACGPRKSN